MNRKGYLITSTGVLTVGLGLLAGLALLNRHNQTGGFNQEIQYDDFAFSALNVRKVDTPARHSAEQHSDSEFYLVTMKVANHARRVNYTFKKAAAILVDDRGNEYHQAAGGQQSFEEQPTLLGGCESEIPPGGSCLTDVVFELPAGARISHLRFSEGGAVGDLADTIFYGKKVIKVDHGER